jgi:hypothetical protein
MKLIAHLLIVLRLRIWSYISTSLYAFMAFKYRDSLTLCIEFWWEIPLKLPFGRQKDLQIHMFFSDTVSAVVLCNIE